MERKSHTFNKQKSENVNSSMRKYHKYIRILGDGWAFFSFSNRKVTDQRRVILSYKTHFSTNCVTNFM